MRKTKTNPKPVNMVEIRPAQVERPTWVKEGETTVLLFPERYYRERFPLAARKKLPTYIAGTDGPNYIIATPIPEQKAWKLAKIPRPLVDYTGPQLVQFLVKAITR